MSTVDPRTGLRFSIAPDKITSYLLDLNSPEGRGKAKFFLEKGFTAASLPVALLAHGVAGTVRATRQTRWGTVFEITGPMSLPSGSVASFRSVWQVDDGVPGVARLLTAHLD